MLPALLLQGFICSRGSQLWHHQPLTAASHAQSISFRDAIFHRVMVDEPGFKQEEFMCDVVHPNKLGHRCFLTNSSQPTPTLRLDVLVRADINCR